MVSINSFEGEFWKNLRNSGTYEERRNLGVSLLRNWVSQQTNSHGKLTLSSLTCFREFGNGQDGGRLCITNIQKIQEMGSSKHINSRNLRIASICSSTRALLWEWFNSTPHSILTLCHSRMKNQKNNQVSQGWVTYLPASWLGMSLPWKGCNFLRDVIPQKKSREVRMSAWWPKLS